MAKRDDGFEEDTLRRSRAELRKTEDRVKETDNVIAEVDRIVAGFKQERGTNHWAKTIYDEWLRGSRTA